MIKRLGRLICLLGDMLAVLCVVMGIFTHNGLWIGVGMGVFCLLCGHAVKYVLVDSHD